MIFIFKIGFIRSNKKKEKFLNKKIIELTGFYSEKNKELKEEIAIANRSAHLRAETFFNKFEERISALEKNQKASKKR